MDRQAPTISVKETEDFMTILQLMDPSLVEGYRKFLHEVITQGISHHNFTLNTLNKCLMNYSEAAIQDMVTKAISFYEMEAPGDVKSFAYL